MRLDKWLWAARFFKTRSQAADGADGGKVKLNGAAAKPARELKPGDRLHIRAEVEAWEVEVLGSVLIHSAGANGSFRVQGKARWRRQWSFHGEPPQRRHGPGKPRSLRVAAKSAGCVVALLVKGVAIDCVARLAVDAFSHNASGRMNENRP